MHVCPIPFHLKEKKKRFMKTNFSFLLFWLPVHAQTTTSRSRRSIKNTTICFGQLTVEEIYGKLARIIHGLSLRFPGALLDGVDSGVDFGSLYFIKEIFSVETFLNFSVKFKI